MKSCYSISTIPNLNFYFSGDASIADPYIYINEPLGGSQVDKAKL